MSSPPAPALSARGVTKDYGDLVALEPLDLEIPQGQRVALIGHNGSGKTTLMRMAAGVLEPSGGTIRILGHEAGALEARAALSYLADTPVLYDDLSVLEHIEYTCGLHRAEDWERRAVSLLVEFGLSERADDLPARFSRGLRQKTAIILALIRPFELFMVDEPFVGLDPPGRQALIRRLGEVSNGGATVVVATHQLDFVELVERCVALRDGQVVYDGPPGEVDVSSLVG
jgi:ABC-type multidrug transport system ATPase subunit